MHDLPAARAGVLRNQEAARKACGGRAENRLTLLRDASATKRFPVPYRGEAPEVPPLANFLPGYEVSAWVGIGAPANAPVEIIAKLNREINAALADPQIKSQLADLGATVLAGSPADFGKFIGDENEKWGKVVKFSGAKVE